jgi:hypothetical protein
MSVPSWTKFVRWKCARAHLGPVPVWAPDLRAAEVGLQHLRHDHARSLHLVTVVLDVRDAAGVRAGEIAQPAPVVLGFERKTFVLDPAVDARHFIRHAIDGDPGAEQVAIEDDVSVREAGLAVVDGVRVRLILGVLPAVGEVCAEPRVLLVVAEGAEVAKLAGRRRPGELERLRVQPGRELRGADPQAAEAVSEHHRIREGRRELSPDPDAHRVRAAKELVRHRAVVHAEPVRKLVLVAPDGRQGAEPAAESDQVVEDVAEVSPAHHLTALARRRVRRPEPEGVAKLRVEKPAGEGQEHLVQLDVLPDVDGLRVAEIVDVGRVEPLLVQVAQVREETDVDQPLVALVDPEPDGGQVLEELLLLFGRLLLGRLRLPRTRSPEDERGRAAFRDPNALLVVAPRLAELARRLSRGFGEDDALRRVGGTVLALARLRRARHARGGRVGG